MNNKFYEAGYIRELAATEGPDDAGPLSERDREQLEDELEAIRSEYDPGPLWVDPVPTPEELKGWDMLPPF